VGVQEPPQNSEKMPDLHYFCPQALQTAEKHIRTEMHHLLCSGLRVPHVPYPAKEMRGSWFLYPSVSVASNHLRWPGVPLGVKALAFCHPFQLLLVPLAHSEHDMETNPCERCSHYSQVSVAINYAQVKQRACSATPRQASAPVSALAIETGLLVSALLLCPQERDSGMQGACRRFSTCP